jgi:hypothetical protein
MSDRAPRYGMILLRYKEREAGSDLRILALEVSRSAASTVAAQRSNPTLALGATDKRSSIASDARVESLRG